MKLKIEFETKELIILFKLLEILESREDIKEYYTEQTTLIKKNIASVINLEKELHGLKNE